MSNGTPARDFLLPRLTALIDEAVAHGFTRQVAVAVLIDLITAPDFDTADPDPEADSDPHPDYERSPDDPPMIDGVVIRVVHAKSGRRTRPISSGRFAGTDRGRHLARDSRPVSWYMRRAAIPGERGPCRRN